jgi:hypothetical protein
MDMPKDEPIPTIAPRTLAQLENAHDSLEWRLCNLLSLEDVVADAIVAMAQAAGEADGDFTARFLLALEDRRRMSQERDGVAYRRTIERIKSGLLPEKG